MPIVNIYFSKIEANRERNIKGNINVKASLTFKNVEEEKSEVKDKKILRFLFDFSLEYDTEAKIYLSGFLIYVDDPKTIDKLKNEWKKDKQFMKILYNFALLKCNIKALFLEDQLGLPPHLNMPRVK